MTSTAPHIVIEIDGEGRAIVRIDARPHWIQESSVEAARQAALQYVFETVAPAEPLTLTASENGQTTPLVMDAAGAVRLADPASVTPPEPAQEAMRSHPMLLTEGAPASGWGPPPPQDAQVNGFHHAPGFQPAFAPPPTQSHDQPLSVGPVWQQQSGPQPEQQPAAPPSLQDLRAQLAAAPEAPARWGLRGRLTRAGMRVSPGTAELAHRQASAAVQRSLRGPKTIAVVNIKGGANKTGTSFLLGATIGRTRGGFTLAWDNNENMGTLAQKGVAAPHHRANAVDFLRELNRFESLERSRVGDLDNYVRGQGDNRFDILASDEDDASLATIDGDDFRAMHRVLQRFYRVIIVDTGNNVKAANYRAAIETADQLVVAATAGGDEVAGAIFTLSHLTKQGHGDLVRNAVTVLSKRDADVTSSDLTTYTSNLSQWTRAVVHIPYDPAMPRAKGSPINYDALSEASREAWLHAAATVISGLD